MTFLMRHCLSAFVLLVMVAAFGCGNDATVPIKAPAPSTQDSSSAPSKGNTIVNRPKGPKADSSLTASEFAKEYKANKEAAKAKYQGKVIELKGTITGMGHNVSHRAHLTLAGEDDSMGVQCYTTDAEPWKQYAPGQKVTLQGKWADFAISAALVDCSVIDADQNPAIELKAAQLAKEYTANREATIKKYDKKYLILSGEVVVKEQNNAGAVTLELQGDGETRVKCAFTFFEKEEAEPLKAGQKVRLIGEFTLNFGQGDVKLYSCLLMK